MAWSKKQKGVVIGGVAVLAAIAVVGGVTLTRINEAPRADAVTAEEQAADASSFDLTTQNAATRPRLDALPQAVEELQSSGFTPIEEGKLTVAVTVSNAPLGATASDDNSVPIGLGPDIGQLVADGLGLEYNPVIVSWDDWPLGIQSGKYDVITSNVTVTEERKELYDFASWRKDLLGFYVKADSPITKIDSRDDISGLKIIVGSGTNQEQILLN